MTAGLPLAETARHQKGEGSLKKMSRSYLVKNIHPFIIMQESGYQNQNRVKSFVDDGIMPQHEMIVG